MVEETRQIVSTFGRGTSQRPIATKTLFSPSEDDILAERVRNSPVLYNMYYDI